MKAPVSNNVNASVQKLFKRIKGIYDDAINQITIIAATIPYAGQVIALDQFPALANKIQRVIENMHASIYSTTVNSIKENWQVSSDRNNILVDKRLGGKRPSDKAAALLYDSNLTALSEFIDRKESGLNLSDRVWNTLDLFGPELERALLLGISHGESAAEMTKDVQQYLKEPDKLFRRVRDASGQLRLSKAAQDYHPGQGVYRSSYKNALRLTGTETNLAYRKADNVRWNQLPFVVGIEVHVSGNHPKYDICDELAGGYPKDFVFTGWHPQCICYQTPKLLSDAEYDKYEDQILGIGTFDGQASAQVTDTPKGFNDFLEDNKTRINGWSSTPYWVKDNPQYTAVLK